MEKTVCQQQNASSSVKGDSTSCVFCLSSADDEDKYGKFLSKEGENITVHQYCLLFASGLAQNGGDDEGFDGFLCKDIDTELRRAKRLKCSYCHVSGASIGCVAVKCSKKFHFGCGRDKQALFQFFGSFNSFCRSHRPTQKDLQCNHSAGAETCPICLMSVDAHDLYETLKSPCCKRSWFHRECVQRQATASGIHFFRCAVCNNIQDFQDEMLRMGIHIPDRDAVWESGDAFADLLETYNRCDADVCLCKKGREHGGRHGKWKIRLCDVCGQCGTHKICQGWVAMPDIWECPTCAAVKKRCERQAAALQYLKGRRSPISQNNFFRRTSNGESTPSSKTSSPRIVSDAGHTGASQTNIGRSIYKTELTPGDPDDNIPLEQLLKIKKIQCGKLYSGDSDDDVPLDIKKKRKKRQKVAAATDSSGSSSRGNSSGSLLRSSPVSTSHMLSEKGGGTVHKRKRPDSELSLYLDSDSDQSENESMSATDSVKRVLGHCHEFSNKSSSVEKIASPDGTDDEVLFLDIHPSSGPYAKKARHASPIQADEPHESRKVTLKPGLDSDDIAVTKVKVGNGSFKTLYKMKAKSAPHAKWCKCYKGIPRSDARPTPETSTSTVVVVDDESSEDSSDKGDERNVTPRRDKRSDSNATPRRDERSDSNATLRRDKKSDSNATPRRDEKRDSITTSSHETRSDINATPLAAKSNDLCEEYPDEMESVGHASNSSVDSGVGEESSDYKSEQSSENCASKREAASSSLESSSLGLSCEKGSELTNSEYLKRFLRTNKVALNRSGSPIEENVKRSSDPGASGKLYKASQRSTNRTEKIRSKGILFAEELPDSEEDFQPAKAHHHKITKLKQPDTQAPSLKQSTKRGSLLENFCGSFLANSLERFYSLRGKGAEIKHKCVC
ncbi:nucleolar protein dao-5 isoform X2 [Nematostella vectensis]|uniref:nucleolar protein dao-5 isoform X2 n=1 Tax=Nematostella vectensis TaxID=45351 RepID=UPI0020776104|nr:nucleolar protein dao-5 isoform X2 [Nematostella vectensis]